MVSVHRTHFSMIHIAPTQITKTKALLHHPHHQQWEDTAEKVQHNLLCGHTTRSNQSHMFVVWLNYLRHVRVSPKNYIPQFGTCSHMPFHVLCGVHYVIMYLISLICTTSTRFNASAVFN
jgi:hypothetical protein